VRLDGLDGNKQYRVKEINLYPGSKSSINKEQIYTGDFLMKIGINPNINPQRTSVILEVTEVTD
jgi:alpha-galactosidase